MRPTDRVTYFGDGHYVIVYDEARQLVGVWNQGIFKIVPKKDVMWIAPTDLTLETLTKQFYIEFGKDWWNSEIRSARFGDRWDREDKKKQTP